MYHFSDTKQRLYLLESRFFKRKHKGKGVLDIYQIIFFNFLHYEFLPMNPFNHCSKHPLVERILYK